MNHIRAKLLVAALVLGSAVSYLAVAGVRRGWVYHVTVDAFLADARYRTQRVRIAGTVDPKDLQVNRGLLQAAFVVRGQAKSVPVVYHGVVPDLFKAGCDVVLEGQLDGAGVFQADLLMTKCASKYDAKTGRMAPATQLGAAPAEDKT